MDYVIEEDNNGRLINDEICERLMKKVVAEWMRYFQG